MRIKDVLLSAGALLLVLFALMLVDGRVREHVGRAVAGSASPQAVAAAGGQLQYVAGVILTTARDQSIEHAPMVMFVVAAAVLVAFMLRL
jgi:hypothetical protein